jgi:hypothetical protein
MRTTLDEQEYLSLSTTLLNEETACDALSESIMKGLQDVAQNRTISHSEAKKRYEKWLI